MDFRKLLLTVGLLGVTFAGGAGVFKSSGSNAGTGLAFDFSGGTIPSGITPSARTGDSLILATSASTATIQAAGSQGVCENRGGGAVGCESFPSLINLLPAPFNFASASYGKSATVTADATTAPDGTSTADKINDTSAVAVQVVNWTGLGIAGQRPRSIWAKLDTPNPSVSGGWVADAGAGQAGTSFATLTTNWQRVTAFGFNVQFMSLDPAGFTPGIYAGNDVTTFTASGTGAIDVWGGSMFDTPTSADMPGIATAGGAGGSTGPQDYQISSSLLANTVSSGDFDIAIQLSSTQLGGGSGTISAGYVFSANTAGGLLAVNVDTNGIWRFIVNDAEKANVLVQGTGSALDVDIRATNKASLGTSTDGRFRVCVNHCCQVDRVFNATGTVQVPSAFYLGSNAGASYLPAMFKRISFPAGVTPSKFPAKVVIIGDSNSDSFGNMIMRGSLILDGTTGSIDIVNLAVGGANIASQQTTYDNSEYKADQSILAFDILIGGNNVRLLSQDSATILSLLQALITDLHTDVPNAKIIVHTLLPDKASFTGGMYATWQAVNTAIAACTFTGVTLCDATGSTTVNDGSDNIRAGYLYDSSTHLNDYGRSKFDEAVRADLVQVGVLSLLASNEPPLGCGALATNWGHGGSIR